MTQRIVLASNNAGKIREMNSILKSHDINIIAQSEFAIPEVEETGLTFVENAILKARHASQLSQLPAIADDSGIEVDALQGRPGIYSARFAGVGASDEENLNKLLTEMEGVDTAQRTARFQCIIVYLRHSDDPTPIICQGTWEGMILTQPSGKNGFGYDPVFYLPDYKCSSAELTAEVKNTLSHRGQALQKLVSALSNPVKTQ